jgi:hypothetical protein
MKRKKEPFKDRDFVDFVKTNRSIERQRSEENTKFEELRHRRERAKEIKEQLVYENYQEKIIYLHKQEIKQIAQAEIDKKLTELN